MKKGKRIYWILGLGALIALMGLGGTLALGPEGVPGQIDDGAELLGQASITLEEAIAAAQGAYSGELGEVDLEDYEGQLVFNIDIGDKDVKVSASDGTVLGYVSDD